MRVLRRPAFLLLLASLLLLAGCHTAPRSCAFTPWMRLPEFSARLDQLEAKQADGKNFWSRGHWVTAVEGRWHDGAPEFRIRIGDAPAGRAYWWYWWFNQSPQEFNAHLHRLSNEGFTLAQFDEFKWPDGSTRYSGVWHKVAP